MMRLLRLFWSEPRPTTAPRNSSDGRLFFVLAAAVLLEVAVRDDLHATSAAFLVNLALTPTVLWRRSHPLLAAGIAFAATGLFEAAALITGWDAPDMNASAFLLVLAYALNRWGAGREALLGLPIIVTSATLGLARDDLSAGEFLGGFAVLLAPIALGIAGRYRQSAQETELEDVRSRERLNLARDLHDTVAHHVSAIAVRAQAGVVTSAQDSTAAVDALRAIGDEASRTLREMRELVRVLRDDEQAELTPAPHIEDLERLAGGDAGEVLVEVDIAREASALSPAVSRALYRIAQEAITNARRHAVGATFIRVAVTVDATSLSLRVRDDGERVSESARVGGYGLIGMAERVQLLGGTLDAGSGPERGWTVAATLPHSRNDTAS